MNDRLNGAVPGALPGRERLADALLHGDRAAVSALMETGNRQRLVRWKDKIMSELTSQYLAGSIPFCQLTAVSQAAMPLCRAEDTPVACCGAVAGNTSAIGQNYMMMLLRAWGVPTISLGTDTAVDAFLQSVAQYGLRFVICVVFCDTDIAFIRQLDAEARRRRLRERFCLLMSGFCPDQSTLASLPVDCPDSRAAAAAEWVVRAWKG